MTSTPGPQDRRRDERDLPGAQASMPVIGEHGIEPARPEPTPAPRPSATSRPAETTGGRTASVVSIFGDAARTGRWRAGRSVQVFSLFGDTVIDLREADFDGDEIVIEGAAVFGDTKVIVPPGAAVDLGGFTLFGDHKYDHRPGTAPAGFPRVRVSGWSLFGDVKVKSLEIGETGPKWLRRLGG